MKLTNDLVEKANPGAKPYRLFDGFGLYIEVAPNGTKAWRFKYRFGGKEKRLSLGIFPLVSVEQARIELLKEKKVLEQGKDPSVERQLKSSENEGLNHKLPKSEKIKVDRQESVMEIKHKITSDIQDQNPVKTEVESMNDISRSFRFKFQKFILNQIIKVQRYPHQLKQLINHLFKKLSKKIMLLISLMFLGIGLLIFMQYFDLTSMSSENNSTITSDNNFSKDRYQNQVLWTKYLALKQKNIQFNDDPELKTLVKVWNKQEKNIAIRGYADGRGEKIYNLNLANERAWQALTALKNIGLHPNRIRKMEAIVPQGSESCAAQNKCQEYMKIEINLVN